MAGTRRSARWPFLLPLVVIALLGLAFGKRLLDVAGGVDPKSIPTVLLNAPAPALDLPALPGHGAVTSADLKGRVTLVNFFGSWCATCVTEHPVLMEIAKSGQVALIGVAWRDVPENTERWLAKYGDPFEKIGQDPKSVAAIDFGVVAAPESFLIDANGIIRYKQAGAITAEDWKNKILPLIAQLKS
jgi:cytochrome c biogenesis protein CcmG/thiol:disulfide interchange protein DsbE